MRAWKALMTCLISATTFGCGGEAILGSWESEAATAEIKDEMTLTESGGTRELRFSFPASCGDETIVPTVEVELDVEWTGDADAGYDVEFDCTTATIAGAGGCSSVYGCSEVYEILGFTMDFELECEINESEDELDCEYESGESSKFERTGE
jgi:hypothetical protein